MTKIETVKIARVNVQEVEKFSFINANREINKTNVNDKKREFLKHNCFLNEITINIDNYHILDGQHRIKAYLELIEKNEIPNTTLLNVKYIKLYGISEIDYCKDINSSAKIWKTEDFINRNKETGIYSDLYSKLDALFDFAKPLKYDPTKTLIHKISGTRQRAYRRLLVLLKYNRGVKFNGKLMVREFNDGTLKITDDEIEKAKILITELTEILDIICWGSPCGLEDIAKTWIEVRDEFPFQQWKNVFKKKYDSIIRMPKNNKREWDNIFSIVLADLRKK